MPRMKTRCAVLSLPALALLAVAGGVVVSGCGPGTPFPMDKVSGSVTYDDGSLIPGDRIVLTFVPQTEALDAKTHPRNGFAVVDKATGNFSVVTTSDYGDGLIRGIHKVFVTSVDARDQPLAVIPPRFSSPQNTPLEIDTADTPLKIEIPRPK